VSKGNMKNGLITSGSAIDRVSEAAE